MTRQAFNEITDGLYQRGHSLTWPAAQKRRALEERRITVVVNLWTKVDPDLSGLVALYINWPIPGNVVPPDANTMAFFVAHLLRSGHRVLIHCEAGKNRSVWFTARVLAAWQGMLKPGALAIVMEAVPGASLRAELRKDLE